jgi:hypothetical protein
VQLHVEARIASGPLAPTYALTAPISCRGAGSCGSHIKLEYASPEQNKVALTRSRPFVHANLRAGRLDLP